MKTLNLFLGAALSTAAYANDNRTLECDFTEPFYGASLNLDTGKVVEHQVEFERDGYRIIDVITHRSLNVAFREGSQAARFEARTNAGTLVMEGTLDYRGNNGMSDDEVPFSVVHYSPTYGKQYGGCTMGGLGAYVAHDLDPDRQEFARNATAAISQCFNRAVSDWTIAPSQYLADSTVFHVLYRGDEVPGEPGGVSSTFSSWENERLNESIQESKTPPEDGASYYRTRSAMWDYCSLYGDLLSNRFEN